MNCEVLKNNARDVLVDALIMGSNAVRWTLHHLSEPEAPPTTPASIQHYGTKENCSVSSVEETLETCPDYTRQLAFHQQQLLQGLPEAMQAHHLDMVNRLGKAA